MARNLFPAAAGAAILAIACVLVWREGANPDGSPTRQGDASSTPTAARPMASDETSAPEVVLLAPRVAPGSLQGRPPPSPDRLLPLALQLQRELARVGCYDAEINGVFTPATRRALQAFMDRVNAVLPTDAPDQIQLSLVQAARERVCGAACPAGETLAEGRCISNVVLAGKKSVPAPVPLPAADTARMGLAGPMGERGRGLAEAPQTGAGSNTPQGPAAAAPGMVRAAAAKRPRPASGFFGLAIFKQFEKLGF
jgi:hypothetical protein